ncbi:MAG: hypothetical protein HZA89_09270 [Verrucomicrobia bacterium]|nr:hypothetical protein [Verrucomicrobiota bacterium]
MRTVAQYSFNGANQNATDAKQLFDKSCKAIEAWLAGKGELDANKKTLHLEDGRIAECEIERTTCDSGATAKWVVSEPSGESRFCTTLALANSGAEVALACNLSTGFTDATIAPRPFTARCPNVLRDILGIQPGWRVGESGVPCRAVKFSQAGQVDNLINLLRSPKRALPVVVISSYDGFTLHPDLAGLLSIDVCGLAIVVEINDEVAWEFTNRVGREWSCFNAGLRIYWPHLDLAGL